MLLLMLALSAVYTRGRMPFFLASIHCMMHIYQSPNMSFHVARTHVLSLPN